MMVYKSLINISKTIRINRISSNITKMRIKNNQRNSNQQLVNSIRFYFSENYKQNTPYNILIFIYLNVSI